jgi:hypothetical protein
MQRAQPNSRTCSASRHIATRGAMMITATSVCRQRLLPARMLPRPTGLQALTQAQHRRGCPAVIHAGQPHSTAEAGCVVTARRSIPGDRCRGRPAPALTSTVLSFWETCQASSMRRYQPRTPSLLATQCHQRAIIALSAPRKRSALSSPCTTSVQLSPCGRLGQPPPSSCGAGEGWGCQHVVDMPVEPAAAAAAAAAAAPAAAPVAAQRECDPGKLPL